MGCSGPAVGEEGGSVPGGVTCRIMSSFHPCWVLKAEVSQPEVSQPEVPQLPEEPLKLQPIYRGGLLEEPLKITTNLPLLQTAVKESTSIFDSRWACQEGEW